MSALFTRILHVISENLDKNRISCLAVLGHLRESGQKQNIMFGSTWPSQRIWTKTEYHVWQYLAISENLDKNRISCLAVLGHLRESGQKQNIMFGSTWPQLYY
jgi:predicted TIM-barrel fold metal-dependent hydrolase